VWVPLTLRDEVVGWVGVGRDKFYDWQRCQGIQGKHNGLTPRHFWLQEWEKQAIIRCHLEHKEDGYRRIILMMLDRDVVAVSPASTYRVLKNAGLMRC